MSCEIKTLYIRRPKRPCSDVIYAKCIQISAECIRDKPNAGGILVA